MDSGSCPHRSVLEDGRIRCHKIEGSDQEVSPEICLLCPARDPQCLHFRFSLRKSASSPVTVRWPSGRTEVWDDRPPYVSLLRSACALKKSRVHYPAECFSCPLREHPGLRSWPSVPVPDTPVAGVNNVIPFPGRSVRKDNPPSHLSQRGGAPCP